MDINKIHNQDCLEAMRKMQDNQFDLAIVDPPYGIDIAKNGSVGKNNFTKKNWDKSIPNKKYFIELFRRFQTKLIH